MLVSLQELIREHLHLDQSPAFLTSEDFIRSNEIITTKWSIYLTIGHFVLIISLDLMKSPEVRKAGDRSIYLDHFFYLVPKIFLDKDIWF